METKQIINGLLDRADRVEDQSAGRIMKRAAERLKQLDNQWIPVTERLPEGECIAIGFQNEMLIGWVYADAYSDTLYTAESDGEILRNVTHWMPLPEPPKGE